MKCLHAKCFAQTSSGNVGLRENVALRGNVALQNVTDAFILLKPPTVI